MDTTRIPQGWRGPGLPTTRKLVSDPTRRAARSPLSRYHDRCAGMAEWKTRRTQNPLGASPCGFESHSRYGKRRDAVFDDISIFDTLAVGAEAPASSIHARRGHGGFRPGSTGLAGALARSMASE